MYNTKLLKDRTVIQWTTLGKPITEVVNNRRRRRLHEFMKKVTWIYNDSIRLQVFIWNNFSLINTWHWKTFNQVRIHKALCNMILDNCVHINLKEPMFNCPKLNTFLSFSFLTLGDLSPSSPFPFFIPFHLYQINVNSTSLFLLSFPWLQ